MLTQRTNVLFSPFEYNELIALTVKSGQSMGELIRQAVRQTYKIKPASEDSLQSTLKRIRKLTRNANLSGIDYRKLVKMDRKYE